MNASNDSSVLLGQEVRLRDGAVLRGYRYSPAGDRASVILTITPYGADRHHARGRRFAERGYAFVSLDARGRGDSDGAFVPFATDGDDGHDAVEALAAKPWCDGRVVMWGGSYEGFVQWATAAKAPSHLAAIAPVASVYPGLDFPMRANIWAPFAVRWLSLVDGRRFNGGLFDDDAYWRKVALDHARAGRPYRELDRAAVGRTLPTFQSWLNHPQLDDFWDRLVPSDADLAAMTIPVLTITGHYDDDQAGALRYYERHTALSRRAHDHYLVIGPWDHAGTRTPAQSFGGLAFAQQSVVDLVDLHVGWYDHVLGRAARPAFLRNRVTYYHSGEETWRAVAALRDLGTARLRLYLAGGSQTGSSCGAGRLVADAPAEPEVLGYRSDPRNAAAAGRNEPPLDSLFRQVHPSGTFEGALLYLSKPLTEDLHVTGRCTLTSWLQADVPDFDVEARLYELGDGPPILLCDDRRRARHAASPRTATPWPIGQIASLLLDEFSFFSRQIAAGRRLALVLGPPDRRYEVNQQAGLPEVAREKGKDALGGTIQVHHGGSFGSFLEVPVNVATDA